MNEIAAPTKAYDNCVRRAAAALSESPEYVAAVERGNAALDDIEQAVRLWVENNRPQPRLGTCGTPSPDGRFVCALELHGVEEMHSDRLRADVMPNDRRMVWETPVELPDGFERHTCITVRCAVCGYVHDETEYTHHFPSAADATDGAVGEGWDELRDGRVVCAAADEKHQELRDAVGVIDPDEEQPGACGKCRQPFDPTDTRFDGHAQKRGTPYCRRCVDLCQSTEIADHRCVICA